MLPILCGIGCAVLLILDVAGKLHPERTRSQVLLHLFSLVGALLPLAAMVWVYVLFPNQTDSNPVLQVLRYLYDLPAPLSFLPKLAVAFCAMTWCYTMVRTCSCVPISQTGSTPQQAAKQQLTMLWLSLPFFLLMLVSGVILLVYLLSFWWIFALLVLMFGIIFLPAIIFGAVMLGYVTLLMALPLLLYLVALCHGYCLRQPVPDRLCSLSGLEKALANLFAGGHVSAVAAVDRDSDHYGKDAENTLRQYRTKIVRYCLN